MDRHSSTPRTARRVMPTHSATAAVYRGEVQYAYGILTNLSPLGACIVTDAVLPPGLDVRLKLSFYQQPRLIETGARVVWNRRGRVEEGSFEGLQLHGVRFTVTPVDEKERLEHVLASEEFVTLPEPTSEFDQLQEELSMELDRLGSKLHRSTGGSGPDPNPR